VDCTHTLSFGSEKVKLYLFPIRLQKSLMGS
jgi:hypothetical protein